MTDAEVIAKEVVDTYIFLEKKRKNWILSDGETKEIKLYLEKCIVCMFNEIDGVLDVCKDAYRDDLPDMRKEYHLKKRYPSLEQIEREAYINQVLNPQVEILNRR
jgi:hypothetical protein